MSNPLRDLRPVTELAAVGQVIEFSEKISAFKGLAAILEADLAALDADRMPSAWRESCVSGALQFGFADAAGRVPKLTGSADAKVAVLCQRCLEPFELVLCIEPELLLLGAHAEALAEGFEDLEVWELDEPAIRPQDIIEELLIMAMPLSAMHDNMTECRALLSVDSSADEGIEELVNPFAGLRAQMQQNEKNPDT